VREEAKKNVKSQPKNIAGRFLYDTILHSDKTLEAMIGLVGADKVILGSDYPYDMGMVDCVAHVRGLKISDADKQAILQGNFEKILAGMPK
jgi:aminocarboxymuconate-semialdehyde decarboxylase